MDAHAAGYSPLSQPPNFITINFDSSYEHLSGELKFSGYSSGYNRSITMVCTFKTKIGEVGQTVWDCEFDPDGISNCGFLK